VVRIPSSEAQGRKGLRSRVGGLGHGMLALVSAIPCVLAIYGVEENDYQSSCHEAQKNKAMFSWSEQKEKEFGLVTNGPGELEFLRV